jgi:citrate lyase subunit gamma (acyl carrier protein)
MDCLVTITKSDAGRVIEIRGGAAVRFTAPMEKKINDVLDALEAGVDVRVNVQDNGALDVVLGARVEAAYIRYRGCAR